MLIMFLCFSCVSVYYVLSFLLTVNSVRPSDVAAFAAVGTHRQRCEQVTRQLQPQSYLHHGVLNILQRDTTRDCFIHLFYIFLQLWVDHSDIKTQRYAFSVNFSSSVDCSSVFFQNTLLLVLTVKSTEVRAEDLVNIVILYTFTTLISHTVCDNLQRWTYADSYLFKKMLTQSCTCSTFKTRSVTIATLFIIFIHV